MTEAYVRFTMGVEVGPPEMHVAVGPAARFKAIVHPREQAGIGYRQIEDVQDM